MRIPIILFTFLFFGFTFASVPTQVYNLLSSYNIPNSIINTLTAVNITYSNNTYTALYSNSRLFFLVNDTSNNFVLNVTQIYLIIRNYTIANSYYSINKNVLLNDMHAFENSSLSSLNYCLYETGLNQYTCNVSNSCYSCQTVPSCNLVMYKTDGVTGPFAQDIMKLESAYGLLNSSFNAFYSSIENMNTKNVAYNLAIANSALANITNLTKSLYTNGLFAPTNVTNAMLSQCVFYPNPSTAPWYCFAFGYCNALTYNFSILNNITSIMERINSMPIQESQLYLVAYNASVTESKYIAPILYMRKTAELNKILNVTLANYSSIVNGSQLVLGHISNASLENNLSRLISLRNYTINNFVSINLSAYNKTLAYYIANTTYLYSKLNATYTSMLSLAKGNTALLLKEQLNSMLPNPKLASLSLQELGLNNMLNGKISNVSLAFAELESINKEASMLYSAPFGLVEIARAIDGAFARSMSIIIPMPYSSNVAVAPVYGALLSLLIGIVAFGILFIFYMNLRLKRKIVINRRTMRNWHMLFGIVWLLIILYVILTYLYASKANAFAPISAFDSAVAQSHYVVVALNGTPSLSQYQCASLVSKNLISMQKEPVLIYINNNTCKVGNNSVSLSTCMNYYAVSDIPMVILTNSNSSLIKPYSFYGSYLAFNGNESIMNACYAALLLK